MYIAYLYLGVLHLMQWAINSFAEYLTDSETGQTMVCVQVDIFLAAAF